MVRMINLEVLLKGCTDEAFADGIRIDTELVPLAGPGYPVKPAVYEGGTHHRIAAVESIFIRSSKGTV